MCCGDGIIKTAKHIIVGHTRRVTDVIGLTKESWFVELRMDECHHCEEATWLRWSEYEKFLFDNGITEVVKNFAQLEKLPKLPKYDITDKRRNLFCRLCKCFVYAAARVKDEKCAHPAGNKWDLNRLEKADKQHNN